MINRYWVDLRTCGIYIIDSFIKDPYNPKSVVAQWDAAWDEYCEIYYVPLEIEIEVNKICKKMNEDYNNS